MSAPIVVLIGAPGSGKTRLGKRVARLLDAPFVDSDQRIVAEHGAIADIFEQHGEPHFRQLERDAVNAALRETVVLSLGGGAVMHPETQRELAMQRVVRLTVSAEAVASRITGGRRPLLAGGVDVWCALVAERAPVYDALAKMSWDTSSRPLDSIADEIAAWVANDARIEFTVDERVKTRTKETTA